ncbi:hypothetical protein RDn1_007 [Candidatus Termititenax dinenymphae]|uniref:Uncharacterized protein n=1 Tax=Candidatus Termititenax dinenymphae TaxID=2218523 RepID=A0A388TJ72_9BACT|nr:hypothetical protein RDn1_007 [Candidatus Termititenax dinenymphae]
MILLRKTFSYGDVIMLNVKSRISRAFMPAKSNEDYQAEIVKLEQLFHELPEIYAYLHILRTDNWFVQEKYRILNHLLDAVEYTCVLGRAHYLLP